MKYYNKDRWREEMKRHRRHRAEIFKTPKAPKKWNDEELFMILRKKFPDKEIAKIINRTEKAISSKRKRTLQSLNKNN